MKKFFSAVVCALVACTALVCLFACGSPKTDGKYYLKSSMGEGGFYSLLKKDDDGNYININGGSINPENYWVELKDGKMTVHGSIVRNSAKKYSVNENYEVEFSFTLQERAEGKNQNWYDIYSNGEFTQYCVTKDGKTLVIEFGESGTDDWYNIAYDKK